MVPLLVYGPIAALGWFMGRRVSSNTARLGVVGLAVGATAYAWIGFAVIASEEAARLGAGTRNWLIRLGIAFGLLTVGALLTAIAPGRRAGPVVMIAGLLPPLLISLISFGLVGVLVPAVSLGILAAALSLGVTGERWMPPTTAGDGEFAQ